MLEFAVPVVQQVINMGVVLLNLFAVGSLLRTAVRMMYCALPCLYAGNPVSRLPAFQRFWLRRDMVF